MNFDLEVLHLIIEKMEERGAVVAERVAGGLELALPSPMYYVVPALKTMLGV